MSLTGALYRQFRKPTGVLGALAGWIMAHRPSNIARNRWTVDLLNIGERDLILEIGYGPGLAIEDAARRAHRGHVVGIDHSALMLPRAARRNRRAIKTGLVDLRVGGFELLPQLGETFDKVYSVNVIQFVADRAAALQAIRSVMKPRALLATTYQPRYRGATAEDARRFAAEFSRAMEDAGFRDIRTEWLDLKPMPAVCVLGRR